MVPIVYLIDTRANKIFMSFCNGQSLKSVLYQRQLMSTYVFQVAPFFQSLGRILAKMHQLGITHGDLTTSNIMIIAKENKTYGNEQCDDVAIGLEEIMLIDFGLGSVSSSIEDQAVDLYVLEKTLTASHKNSIELMNTLLHTYENYSSKSCDVIRRLESVRLRGGKRDTFG